MVTLELVLLALARAARLVREDGHLGGHRQVERAQAAHALQPGRRRNRPAHRYAAAGPLDAEVAVDQPRPLRLGKPDLTRGCIDLHPVQRGFEGGEVEDEIGHYGMSRPRGPTPISAAGS